MNRSVAVAVTSGIRNHKKAIAVEGWTNYFIAVNTHENKCVA